MKPEDHYPAYMEEHVLPYILPRREEQLLFREPGKQIYCAFYTSGVSVDSRKQGSLEQCNGIILISHGFTETADKYFEVIYYFLRQGFHVCIPEHCGHGRSYRLTDGDLSLVHIDRWQRYVDDLAFTARAAQNYWKQPLPLFLYAHSMGAGIGAALAAQKPHLFQRILLSSPMIRPSTGNVPWIATKAIVTFTCVIGKEHDYVIGQHAYDGTETFETSCATSPARYAWYREKTNAEPLFQMSGASYGWLREAIRLNKYLMNDAWKNIPAPVLLIQAEKDTSVSKGQQEKFIRKLARAKKTAGKPSSSRTVPQKPSVRFVRIPGAKHELYRADDKTLAKYFKGCLKWFEQPIP
ncbi:MAG: alpha/beta hydrolase [Lachnospiraceae bacterium]|nr:alpha/beta hydrolase [Lachnospiraceae bacterium]